MKHLFITFCWLGISLSFGQNHQIIDTSDYEQRKILVKSFEEKYELFNKQLKNDYKGPLRRELLNFYEYSQSSVLQIITNKKILFDKRYQNYIDSLYTEIEASNPLLQNVDIKVLISKNTSPNALSIGDGTLILNIGLFSFLENEYQLQSVITHELGHQLLEHTKNNIEERAKISVGQLSTKSALFKSLNRDKYNQGERSFNLLKDLLYKQGELKRRQEIEADSLGYVLFKNTNAPMSQFIGALHMLKKFDSVPEIVIDSMTYKKLFDIPEQKFKKSWLVNENFDNYNYELYHDKINLDSLESHPEIDIRISSLENSFLELQNLEKSEYSPSNTFSKLQNLARQAYVENLFYLNEYGLSIYLSMKRLEEESDDSYYKKWLGINFNAIYEAKKKYQLNRYVDRLVPNKQSESYQKFINFIWNLDLNEIKVIADHYNLP